MRRCGNIDAFRTAAVPERWETDFLSRNNARAHEDAAFPGERRSCCALESGRKGELRGNWSVSTLKKVKREAAAQRRLAKVSGKTVFFPRNDRAYGLKRAAFQTENALVVTCAACDGNGGSGRMEDAREDTDDRKRDHPTAGDFYGKSRGGEHGTSSRSADLREGAGGSQLSKGRSVKE